MSEKEPLQKESPKLKQGFWATLSFIDYIELALYILVAICFLMWVVENFS